MRENTVARSRQPSEASTSSRASTSAVIALLTSQNSVQYESGGEQGPVKALKRPYVETFSLQTRYGNSLSMANHSFIGVRSARTRSDTTSFKSRHRLSSRKPSPLATLCFRTPILFRSPSRLTTQSSSRWATSTSSKTFQTPRSRRTESGYAPLRTTPKESPKLARGFGVRCPLAKTFRIRTPQSPFSSSSTRTLEGLPGSLVGPCKSIAKQQLAENWLTNSSRSSKVRPRRGRYEETPLFSDSCMYLDPM